MSDRLTEMMTRAARLIAGEGHSDGLKPVQWQALRYLAAANRFSRTPGGLTAWLGQTKGTVSQTIAALERKGLVTRADDAADRRLVRLALTARGRALLDAAPSGVAAAMLDGLSAQERRALEPLVRRMLTGHLARRGQRAFGQCRDCRHFRPGQGGAHRCALLDVPLDDGDAEAICMEQEAA